MKIRQGTCSLTDYYSYFVGAEQLLHFLTNSAVNLLYYIANDSYYSRLMCAGADAFRPLWARRRLNFVGNPTPLGEATPSGGGETAPRTIVFSEAELEMMNSYLSLSL